MRFSTTQMLIAIACICLVLGAFVRGHYLLGSFAGVAFALLAPGTLFVLIRVVSTQRKYHILRVVVVSAFALGVFAILAMPAQFSRDLGYFIDGHQIERTTRSQLNSIFSNDSRFAKLKFDCGYRKCIVVSVDGTIQSENDLLELRDQILEQCPSVSSRWLYWRLNIAETGAVHDDCDLTIFRERVSDTGNAGYQIVAPESRSRAF